MQTKERIIVHSDINHCYAQIEEMKYPELRDIPMAVGGSEEERHGIILAKNDKAKAFQIKTGESLREALAKCPQLRILKPDYEEYMYYTEKVKDIYREYTDQVESFGLDEAWMDLSESTALFGDGRSIARRIQNRVAHELGMSVSMGVSYNKIFAKIGSDMDKHSGLVEITRQNYQDVIWPLPVSDMFYVGRATKHKLAHYAIETIGQLAQLPKGWMKDRFGKMGELIWWFANGEDVSEVALISHQDPVKSVGNAITAPKDVCTYEEAKLVYYVLVESVASRLREQGLRGNVISITLRSTELSWFSRQRKLTQATNIAAEIMPVVLTLLQENYDFTIPLRTIGVTVSGIEKDTGFTQLNLFVSEQERQRQRKLEETMDAVRERFGFAKIQRCSMLQDRHLTDFNPKEDHVVHPVGFF
ncbi:DNA polymerase IV [[Clostridium] innocuum]|nr:putative DNA polymerase IV [Erysipelotrichaceae bacterium 3_1_53]MCR0348569.1 DNA polymerase IV [[Clostridium] innocuum]RJV89039.1 DNA polymerase IV [Erysipelotrichaceae bacterium AF19-24AC]